MFLKLDATYLLALLKLNFACYLQALTSQLPNSSPIIIIIIIII
jgi:hypothetical protein